MGCCMIGLSSMYGMELPASLQQQFQNDMGMTSEQYMNFINFFSLPNIFFSFFGGILINAIGKRVSVVVFQIIGVLGCVVMCLGVYLSHISVVYIGRSLFAVAAELLVIVQFIYIQTFFKSGLLNMAFAMTVAISRLGSAVAIKLGEPIYHIFKVNLVTEDSAETLPLMLACAFGVVLETISTLFSIGMALIPDPKLEKSEDAEPLLQADNDKAENKFVLRNESMAIHTSISDKKPMTVWTKVKKVLTYTPMSSWIVILIICSFYPQVEVFNMTAKNYFKIYQGIDGNNNTTDSGKFQDYAGTLAMYQNLFAIFLCPVIGIFIDFIKMNAIWVTLGCILAVVSHIILSIQNLASSLLMLSTIILSLGYSSVASAVWILLGYTTPLEKNAIIYGLAQSFQHVAFIVVSKISGVIQLNSDDDPLTYKRHEIMLVLSIIPALIAGLIFIIAFGPGSSSLTKKIKK